MEPFEATAIAQSPQSAVLDGSFVKAHCSFIPGNRYRRHCDLRGS